MDVDCESTEGRSSLRRAKAVRASILGSMCAQCTFNFLFFSIPVDIHHTSNNNIIKFASTKMYRLRVAKLRLREGFRSTHESRRNTRPQPRNRNRHRSAPTVRAMTSLRDDNSLWAGQASKCTKSSKTT